MFEEEKHGGLLAGRWRCGRTDGWNQPMRTPPGCSAPCPLHLVALASSIDERTPIGHTPDVPQRAAHDIRDFAVSSSTSSIASARTRRPLLLHSSRPCRAVCAIHPGATSCARWRSPCSARALHAVAHPFTPSISDIRKAGSGTTGADPLGRRPQAHRIQAVEPQMGRAQARFRRMSSRR